MSRLTLDELRKLRDEKKREIKRRESEGKDIVVTVGMGTCGIAAGAKDTFSALLDQLEKSGIDDAVVKQTGCMGLCYSEPTVEVESPGMPTVVYGHVDGATARKIVKEHLIEGRLVDEHVYDKPAEDIVQPE
ncbi:(2Fe-2S) ferredoxin domain-containing protein [Kiritimatiella glycovorans]|uniref:NADP-reducing hydrogenase subunit HndB n=1 Tax=Kiritimatiella glycovorans TaxID=1307763 RepID=A0A0G3EFS5_9BACT|nr:(2Fe-2S) ferredoxin domain-containing protein [Kiritimatiella glycovorans]AKJ63660.1 NADP-reducing hydrogenase subunit HndB [Kiritimatiella glycovorans]